MTGRDRNFVRRMTSTRTAASLLDVHPQQIRRWTEQYGFPDALIVDGRRAFMPEQILALRAALAVGLPPGDAIAAARDDAGPARNGPRCQSRAVQVHPRPGSWRPRPGLLSRPTVLSLLLAGSLAVVPAASARLTGHSRSQRRNSPARRAVPSGAAAQVGVSGDRRAKRT